MKLNTTNFLLLHSILESDFLILNNNQINNKKKIKNFGVQILNPLKILQSLKQLVRLVQFLKKQKKSQLNFFVENLFQKDIIEKFLLLNKSSILFKIYYKFLTFKRQNNIQLLISFENFICKNKNLLNSLLNEKIFLLHEVSRADRNVNIGNYVLYNDIYNYKKLIFLLTLIDFTFKKSIVKKV